MILFFFFFSSRRRHTRWNCDWSSDVCSSDLQMTKWLRRLAPLFALASFTCALPPFDGKFALTVELVEEPGGRPVPGLIRIRDARGRAIPLPPLLPRGLGLAAAHPSLEWYVL